MHDPFSHEMLNVIDLAGEIPEETLKQLVVKDYKNALYQTLFFQISTIDPDCYIDKLRLKT